MKKTQSPINMPREQLDMYQNAINDALMYMDAGCEPTSALKQAGSDYGIPYGPEMGKFVAYANKVLFGTK